MVQDSVIKWFYRVLMPKIFDLVYIEKDLVDFKESKMIKLLYEVLKKIGNFSETKVLKYSDWANFIAIL